MIENRVADILCALLSDWSRRLAHASNGQDDLHAVILEMLALSRGLGETTGTKEMLDPFDIDHPPCENEHYHE